MTEKYFGDPADIHWQLEKARKNTFFTEYSYFNSPLGEYLRLLTVPGRAPLFERLDRAGGGTVLDLGYSLKMLLELQKQYPQMSLVGVGALVPEGEKKFTEENGIKLIEGSLYHPPGELQQLEGTCTVVVSKHTFTQFHSLNIFSAFEYVWDLLSYDKDPLKTGSAYIFTGNIQLYSGDTHNRKEFSDLCKAMTSNGYDIYFWKEDFKRNVLVMNKTNPDPIHFPVTYNGLDYFWN